MQVTAGTGGDFALLSGNIGDSTSGTTAGLLKTGGGTLVLSGVNSYAGGTSISAGTLAVTSAAALPGGTAAVTLDPALAGSSATLGLLMPAVSANAAPASSGAGTAVVQLGNATNLLTTVATTLTIGGDGGSSTWAVNITDQTPVNAAAIGSLAKVGGGTLTLTGTNSFTGGVSIQGGTVALGNSSAAGTGPVTFAANATTLQAAANNINLAHLWSAAASRGPWTPKATR